MNGLKYISTRGHKEEVTASQAILRGIAPDSGLYVPAVIPKMDFNLSDVPGMSYQELAYEVLKLYLNDYSAAEIKDCIAKAYDEKFDTKLIAPLVSPSIQAEYYFLELFHGKTLAFKDMALSILPHLLTAAAKKNAVTEEIVILTATSGDTGKAALEGFADVAGTKIIVFYPENGVSEVQKRQMITQKGANTCVIAVKGNFDDAQTGVKEIFTDPEVNRRLKEKGCILSSANSINIGRLVPQIVYYFYAYGQMVKGGHINSGDELNFTVPTGNFGNILAGWYAKRMGLPIAKLICASNDNKVLFDFFSTGLYDRNREFLLTVSPSMDILVSSNLERLLFHLSGSATETKRVMLALNKEGKYSFDWRAEDIVPAYAAESECLSAISELCKKNYIMDTHTAVAFVSAEKYYAGTEDKNKNVIVSTASPYKFADAICAAINEQYRGQDSFKLLQILAQLRGESVPEQIRGLENAEIIHNAVCRKDEMQSFVEKYLK